MYAEKIMTFHDSNGSPKSCSFFGLKKYTHEPYNKAMFLKKEYDAIISFFKANPRTGIMDCSVELGYHSSWVRARVKDLVEQKKLKAIKETKRYLKFEVCCPCAKD